MLDTAIFDTPLDASKVGGIQFSIVEAAVVRLFDRIGQYEEEVGLSEISPTRFVPNRWGRTLPAELVFSRGEVPKP